MRLLQRKFEVETRYGGGFVQEIDGVGGGRRSGRPVDWFFYVNGIEASTGAAARRLAPGDRVWWDHHDWGAAMRVPAVVGSFPAPFVSSSKGKRVPVRIDCGAGAQRACREVQKRLTDAGAQVGGRRRSARRRAAACCACSSGAGPTSAATRRRGASRAGRRSPASTRGRRPRATASSCSTRAAASVRTLGAGLRPRGRDELPRPAADLGRGGHRRGRRRRRGGRAERDAPARPLRRRDRERAASCRCRCPCRRTEGRRPRDLPPPCEPAARGARGRRLALLRGPGRRGAVLRAPAAARRRCCSR